MMKISNSKLLFLVFWGFLFTLPLIAQNSAPEVSNVVFAQRTDGSGIVDVYYDLSDADGDALLVTMQVSGDDGATWQIIPTQISGDIGEGITQGLGKHIIWNAADEEYALEGNQYKFKIIADDLMLVDIDGNVYQTIQIGDQLWMAENLKVTKYRDGSVIPNITNNGDWGGLSSGAYGDYDNNPTNSDTYGRLYNWYTVDDSRGVCPDGWHVPSGDEYTILTDYVGGEEVAGGKMKSTGTIEDGDGLWNYYSDEITEEATNESGFTGLPAGYRLSSNGTYYHMGNYGFFWSSSEGSSYYAWNRLLYYDFSDVARYNYYKLYGFSVRCLGD